MIKNYYFLVKSKKEKGYLKKSKFKNLLLGKGY